ncbi:MAG: GNAT family N-acetyltransferase [Pyrinomonadaceae bacterium]
MLETKIVKGGTDVIDQLAAEWIRLCEEGKCNDPFLRPEWYRAFVDNFGDDVELLTVRSNGRLRAVLLLWQKLDSIYAVPARKIQGVFNLNSPRFDMIHGSDESERGEIVSAVWNGIKRAKTWDAIEFRLVKRNSWLAEVIALAQAENYSTGVWPMDGAPCISVSNAGPTTETSDDFFSGSRKHFGKELSRRLRRLNEQGAVEFSVSSTFEPDLMQRYLELENRGWKGRNGTSAISDPKASALHRDFAAAVAQQGALLVYELKLNGQTIAMSINIRHGDKVFHWKTSYDEDYAKYSPGNLLFRQLLTDCIEYGSTEIDFLSPSTPNKSVWATSERDHVAFYIFRRGIIGSLLWHWTFSVIGSLRTLKQAPAH